MYTRNPQCIVTGTLLEMKDLDIASNFLVSQRLRPSSGAKAESINTEADPDDEEFDQKQCVYLLKFVEQTGPG